MSYLVLLLAVGLVAGVLLLLKWGCRCSWAWKAPIGIAAAGMCLAVAGAVIFFLFMHVMCGQYVFPPVVSPDGKRTARVTEFDCGAVSSFLSSVDIRSTEARFSLSRLRNRQVFTSEQDPRLVQIEWTGERQLTIRHPQVDRNPAAYRCDTVWQDVQIKCETYVPDVQNLARPPEPSRWKW